MPNTTQPLAYYSRRFVRRAFIEDLPEDLLDSGTVITRMITRPQLAEQLASQHARHAGKPAFDRPAYFHLIGMPRASRQVSAGGYRTFHVGWQTDRVASAGQSDTYASSKAALEDKLGTVVAITEPDIARDDDGFGPEVADTYAVGHGGEDGQQAAVLTNLKLDLEGRKLQWHQIETVAAGIGLANKERRERGENRINIRPARSPDLMRAIVADPDCPEMLRIAIVREQQRLASGRKLKPRREEVGAPLVTSDASAIHRWVRSTDAWKAAKADERVALSLSQGRGQRVYDFFDFEFASELDAQGRASVMRDVVAFIARQPGHPDHEVPGAQVPVAAAEHRPDALNHRLNFHGHITHGRHRFLIGEDRSLVERDGEPVCETAMVPSMTDRRWRMQVRTEIARLENIELARVGAAVRLDPRTDREIGNDSVPMKKLYNEATVLARAGIQTPVRLENIAEGWRRRFVAIDRARDADLRRAEKLRDARRKWIEAETPVDAQADLHEHTSAILSLETRAIAVRHERQTIELLIEMTRSAPEEVAQFAPAYADHAMRSGKRTYDSAGWQRRADEATAYLADLDLKLAEERQGIAERLQIEKEMEQTVERAGKSLAFDMASATWLDTSPVESIARVETLAAIPSMGRPIRPSPHRAIDIIDTRAIRISTDRDRLFVASLDDPDGHVAGVDLTSRPLQARLARVKAKQDVELRAIGAYIAKHRTLAVVTEDRETRSPWLERSFAKWQGSRTVATMLADAARAEAVPAAAASTVDRGMAEPVVAASSPLKPVISQDEVDRGLAHQANTSAQRANAMMARLLDNAMWRDGEPTAMASQFLIELHSKPQYYSRGDDGALICRHPGGRRASALALMMRHPAVANHALRYHEAGLNAEPLPYPKLVGVDDRLPSHHHYSAEWIRTAQEEPRQLSARLDALLARRPRLTMDADNLIGVRDVGLVEAAGKDALGLYDPSIQLRLRVHWLIRQEEQRDALAMIASGEVDVALKRQKGSGTLELASKNPVSMLPPLYDPFLDDPAFIAQALDARRSGSPARIARVALLRAWDAASGEPAGVQRVIAQIIMADPAVAGQLARAEREAIAQSIGRASPTTRGSKPTRKGPMRAPRTL